MDAFDRLVGQGQAVALLRQAIARDRIAPAYLFAGPEGVGKQLAAECFIEQFFGDRLGETERLQVQKRLRDRNHPDVLWVEPTYQYQGQRLTVKEATEQGLKRKAPPQIAISQVREIVQFLSRLPLSAPRSVVVIVGAETMAEGAANALLKTLEEPGRATLILIAPSTSSLLPTLVSRCAIIPFSRLPQAAMQQILGQLGYDAIAQNDKIMAIAQGSPGDAIFAWEKLQAMPVSLLERLTALPKTLREALELAKEIDKTLDTETQLWLVDYLQQSYWQQQHSSEILQRLETVKKSLLSYASPRLVWEVALMEMRG